MLARFYLHPAQNQRNLSFVAIIVSPARAISVVGHRVSVGVVAVLKEKIVNVLDVVGRVSIKDVLATFAGMERKLNLFVNNCFQNFMNVQNKAYSCLCDSIVNTRTWPTRPLYFGRPWRFANPKFATIL